MIEWVSVAQAAEAWGVTTQTVRNWIRRKLVPSAFRAGPKLWRIPRDVVMAGPPRDVPSTEQPAGDAEAPK